MKPSCSGFQIYFFSKIKAKALVVLCGLFNFTVLTKNWKLIKDTGTSHHICNLERIYFKLVNPDLALRILRKGW